MAGFHEAGISVAPEAMDDASGSYVSSFERRPAMNISATNGSKTFAPGERPANGSNGKARELPVVKLLIVDDRPENLLALEATLSNGNPGGKSPAPEYKLEFVRASNGPEALRKILQEEFAAILLDVQMPGMDGYETAELIRKRSQSQHTPIIFLTAVSTSGVNVFHGYSLGAVDYLTKPFDPWILRAKVGVFIELYRKQAEIQRLADELREQARLLRNSNEELGKSNKMLGGLYRELEAKSEELRQLNEDLEHRVRQRTNELETANQQLWQAKEAAELANSTKDQFLAVLSHELRTPLTPVLAIVQMINEDASVPNELKSWIDTIGRNVQLEARLIDDLLDLTRIANGKLELHLVPVDIHKLIHETVAICEEEIRAKKLNLVLRLSAERGMVRADPARLQQVLWNLLKNAVKFTGESGTITIATSNTDGGALRCQVTDTGIGIPPEHLKRVFNAFDQGDKAITRRFGGLGLGLAISKALAEQHHGSIWAESAGTEQGATFTIELPVLNEATGTKPEERRAKRSSTPQNNSRILLVEDNDDTSTAMQVLFERKGFTVIVAHSVQSALEIAKTYACDLVISDIGLPDGDGFDVIRKLNEIRPTRGIAISGFGMEEDVRRSLAAGFDAHLVKPIRFDELNDVVNRLIVPSA